MVKQTQDKTLAILTHILGLIAWFIPALIIYLISEDKYTKEHAKNALNWQISLVIYLVASFILIILIIGIFTLIAFSILNLVFSIIAAVKASEGISWKYPLAIPFIK